MSSSIRVASRYLAAKSMYDDLGESPGCGLDKVIERARPTQVVTPPTVVTYALPPRVDPIQKKIDLCLRTLRDRYIIEPPSREH